MIIRSCACPDLELQNRKGTPLERFPHREYSLERAPTRGAPAEWWIAGGDLHISITFQIENVSEIRGGAI
jgi:hypothetical protein